MAIKNMYGQWVGDLHYFMPKMISKLYKRSIDHTAHLRNTVYNNKRPTDLNGHLSIRDITLTLSEGLIFVYQQPGHHRINENQPRYMYRKAAP